MEVSIIAQIDKQTFAIQCGYCHGRGQQPGDTQGWEIKDYWYKTPCEMCDGKGVLKVQVQDMLIPCAVCRGSGLLRDDNYHEHHPEKCPTCKGVGACSLTGQLRIIK